MDFQRIVAYGVFILTSFMLMSAWQSHQHEQILKEVPQSVTAVPAVQVQTQQNVPSVPGTIAKKVSHVISAPSIQQIHVKTDMFEVTIDPKGGNLVGSGLTQYPQTLKSKSPYALFSNTDNNTYLAESGLSSQSGPDNGNEVGTYHVDKYDYSFAPNQKMLNVILHWEKGGVKVMKTYTFTRGSYEVGVHYEINNTSTKPWVGSLYAQFIRNIPGSKPGGISQMLSANAMQSMRWVALSTEDSKYKKYTLQSLEKTNLDLSSKQGWVAMAQHYFVSAWIPPASESFHYYSHETNNLVTAGAVGPAMTVNPGENKTVSLRLYSGPAIAKTLEAVNPTLKLSVDYGFFWMISVVLFKLLSVIHAMFGNWGWAIVAVTFIIKLVLYPLASKSYRSMAKMKELQPKIQALKERYADDRQALNKATMELFSKEKANPMSGCLPLLVQIPIFMGFYWMLMESVQLRQAPFIGWIHDLSAHDPLYILPILTGLSLWALQKLSPTPADDMQAKMMLMIPVILTIVSLNLPAGLVLYWVVNNSLSILQQWSIMHSYEKSHSQKNKRK